MSRRRSRWPATTGAQVNNPELQLALAFGTGLGLLLLVVGVYALRLKQERNALRVKVGGLEWDRDELREDLITVNKDNARLRQNRHNWPLRKLEVSQILTPTDMNNPQAIARMSDRLYGEMGRPAASLGVVTRTPDIGAGGMRYTLTLHVAVLPE